MRPFLRFHGASVDKTGREVNRIYPEPLFSQTTIVSRTPSWTSIPACRSSPGKKSASPGRWGGGGSFASGNAVPPPSSGSRRVITQVSVRFRERPGGSAIGVHRVPLARAVARELEPLRAAGDIELVGLLVNDPGVGRDLLMQPRPRGVLRGVHEQDAVVPYRVRLDRLSLLALYQALVPITPGELGVYPRQVLLV